MAAPISRASFFRASWGLVFFALALGAAGCGQHSKPSMTYMPDMAYSPALKAQEAGSMRLPVKGTIARGFAPYEYANEPELAGRELKNPLRPTLATFKRGQKMFNTYCIVCHGSAGEGDGYIVPKYPRPPSLQSEKVINYPDGRIFHIATVGQNLMPSYASQISREDRWAIIHYIRALQRSKHPTPEDLKYAEQLSK